MTVLEELRAELRVFAEARDWLMFHDPKNLAMAIASEAGELLAEFRWLSPAEADPAALSQERLAAVRSEMADVLIFLIRMADVLNVDLVEAVRSKSRINEERFPAPS